MNNSIKILPKINTTLPDLRSRAKKLGYKLRTKTTYFEGDPRIVWTLIHIESGTEVNPCNVVSPDKFETYRKGYELIENAVIRPLNIY